MSKNYLNMKCVDCKHCWRCSLAIKRDGIACVDFKCKERNYEAI